LLARLRRDARDEAAWGEFVRRYAPQTRLLVQRTLQYWQKDTDLAGLRDKTALAKLPDAERQAWQRLWAEVDQLVQKAASPKPGC
jgi:hypothetical protein